MATKVNLKRPGKGTTKLDIFVTSNSGRHTLRAPLLGTIGEQYPHICEIKELQANISHPAITYKSDYPLLQVFGKRYNSNVRNIDDIFEDTNVYLGNDGGNDLGVVQSIPTSEFKIFLPRVHCVSDLILFLEYKINRINELLECNGWIGGTIGAQGADREGLIPNSVGQVGYGVNDAIFDSHCLKRLLVQPDEPLLSLKCTSAGNIGILGSEEFWENFGIWCSPLFRELTGFPEFIVQFNSAFPNEDVFMNGDLDEFVEGVSHARGALFSSKSILSTVEGRRSISIYSDIPLKPEGVCNNEKEEQRNILAYYNFHDSELDIKRDVSSLVFDPEWAITERIPIGPRILDDVHHTGFAAVVLPSLIPSLNVHPMLKTRVWDFDTETSSIQEVPLLKNTIDYMSLRLAFTIQI